VRVQPGGEHRQVATDDLGVGRIIVGDTGDERGALTEPGLEYPVDLGHPAPGAGFHAPCAAAGVFATRGQRGCRHEDSDRL
jgi:hypothetical protein